MEIKKGIGVSPGVVISTAVVLDAEDLLIPKRQIEAADVEAETARFRAAVDEAFPVRADGRRILPFPRLFLLAVR